MSALKVWGIETVRRRKRRSTETDNPRNMKNVVPLTRLREGESAELAYTVGGFGLVRRLAEMGLTSGVKLRVLRKGVFRGPLEIEVRGVALALGRGVASRVYVRPIGNEPNG